LDVWVWSRSSERSPSVPVEGSIKTTLVVVELDESVVQWDVSQNITNGSIWVWALWRSRQVVGLRRVSGEVGSQSVSESNSTDLVLLLQVKVETIDNSVIERSLIVGSTTELVPQGGSESSTLSIGREAVVTSGTTKREENLFTLGLTSLNVLTDSRTVEQAVRESVTTLVSEVQAQLREVIDKRNNDDIEVVTLTVGAQLVLVTVRVLPPVKSDVFVGEGQHLVGDETSHDEKLRGNHFRFSTVFNESIGQVNERLSELKKKICLKNKKICAIVSNLSTIVNCALELQHKHKYGI